MNNGRGVDTLALTAGTIRFASGVSFLVAPEAANRLWGDNEDNGPTASLLLRSMGYRDALIGGLLLVSAFRGNSAPWFLASAGADAADLLGGIANHDRMSDSQKRRGLGGAALGIGIGLLGAARRHSTRAIERSIVGSIAGSWWLLTIGWLYVLWLAVLQVLAALHLRSPDRYGICESDSDALRWAAASGYLALSIVVGGAIVASI